MDALAALFKHEKRDLKSSRHRERVSSRYGAVSAAAAAASTQEGHTMKSQTCITPLAFSREMGCTQSG